MSILLLLWFVLFGSFTVWRPILLKRNIFWAQKKHKKKCFFHICRICNESKRQHDFKIWRRLTAQIQLQYDELTGLQNKFEWMSEKKSERSHKKQHTEIVKKSKKIKRERMRERNSDEKWKRLRQFKRLLWSIFLCLSDAWISISFYRIINEFLA